MIRALLISGLLIGACRHPEPVPRFTPAWEPVDAHGPGWLETIPVLLLADCQIHNLYSQALPERNLSAEAVLGTAIRPPQLDLFAPNVLAWVLEYGSPEAELVVHLGDALDLACQGEFETFVKVMNGDGRPWMMAPGNHDSFYFGSYDPDDEELWDLACYGAGDNFTKDRFIRHYLAALMAQDEPSFVSLAMALGVEAERHSPAEVVRSIPDAFEWHRPADNVGFLGAICWKIDMERPWRSFLLQSIDVPLEGRDQSAGRLLLLDSCQYQRQPALVPNGWQSYPLELNCGASGEMLPDQLRKLREWLEADSNPGFRALAFHHPFDMLAARTRSSLGWLWRHSATGAIFTAHTHVGYFKHHDLGGGVEELELNIGSTTDWPMEWRTVRGLQNPEKKSAYMQAERGTLVDALRARDGYFAEDWELPLDAPDDYRKYKSGESATGVLLDFYLLHHLTPKWLGQSLQVRPNAAAQDTENQVKETLLLTYGRLIQTFPTQPGRGAPQWPDGTSDDGAVLERIRRSVDGDSNSVAVKIALLEELAAFEESRHSWDAASGEPTDDLRERYKLSAAAWASRFEGSSGRFLRIEDDMIRIDWGKLEERIERSADGAAAEGADGTR